MYALLLRLMLLAFRHIKDIVFNDNHEIDEVASRANMKGQLAEEAQSALIEVLGGLIKKSMSSEYPIVFREDIEFLRQRYSQKVLNGFVEEAIARVEDSDKIFTEYIGVRRGIFGDDPRLREQLYKRLREGPVLQRDLDSLSDSYSTSELLRIALSDKYKSLWIRDSVDLRQEAGVSVARIDQRISEVDKLLKEKKLGKNETYTDQQSDCLGAALIGLENSPASGQLVKIAGAKERVLRNTYKEKLSGYLSKPSSMVLNPFVSGWILKAPLTQGEYLKSFEIGLQEQTANNRKSIQDFQKLNEKETQIFLAVEAVALNEKIEKNIEAKDLKEFCEEQLISPNPDAAYTQNDGLLLGIKTLKDLEAEQAVLFHEYSHMVEYRINTNKEISKPTKAWHKKGRDCLLSLNGNDPARLGEDWADMVAYNFSSGPAHMLCDRFPDEDDEYFSLKNVNPGDKTHSSLIFRYLHGYYVKKGSVPDACAQALSEKGQTFQGRNCLKP